MNSAGNSLVICGMVSIWEPG